MALIQFTEHDINADSPGMLGAAVVPASPSLSSAAGTQTLDNQTHFCRQAKSSFRAVAARAPPQALWLAHHPLPTFPVRF